MTRSTPELLREALFHFETAIRHSTDRDLDVVVVDAVAMRIAAGVEALNRLPITVRTQLFGEAWALMWGMRNRIAHGYLLVDAEVVRATVSGDIPVIVGIIQAELGRQ